MNRRLTAIMLAVLMLFLSVFAFAENVENAGTGSGAEQVRDTPLPEATSVPVKTDEPIPTEIPSEPTAAPTQEPAEPNENPSQVPAEDPTEAPVVPTEMPSGEAAEEPTQEPNGNTADIPADEPTDEPTDEPADTPVQEHSEDIAGTASVGNVEIPALAAGSAATIAIPVTFRAGSDYWYTNMLPSGSVVAYKSDRAISAYSEDILNALDSLTVSIGGDMFSEGSGSFSVIGNMDAASAAKLGLKGSGSAYTDPAGTAYAVGQKYNAGFAVFTVKVAKTVSNDFVNIPVTITWSSAAYGSGSINTSVEAVTTNRSSSGSGSSGSGGYSYYYGSSTSKSASEAKLIIDGVSTDPADPKAGDEFDMILTLRNTSGKQAVQNITVTCEAESDAVLPVSGAFSTYITAIESQKTHEARFNVRAQGDIEDKPVKIFVTLEYEDSSAEPHGISQSVVINVEQPMRIKLDTPVMPSGSAVAGESYNVSMGIYNLGRTTLYNVTVTGVSDDPTVSTGASYYCGNMESGTGKTAEIRFIPSEQGTYTTDLLVTYENSIGDTFSATESVSFYVEAYEEDDWLTDPSLIEPEATPRPDRADRVLEVMSILPWWVYASVGGLFMLVVVCIGVGARHRRMRAYENDEME